MAKTSHNLNGQFAEISFNLLFQTAQIAVGLAKVNCERALGKAQTASFASDYRGVALASRELAEAAEALRLASDTLYNLNESRTRTLVLIQ